VGAVRAVEVRLPSTAMAVELTEGAALLIAGHGTDDALVHTLGSIGEALLATSPTWKIRRLAPAAGERQAPNRANLKRLLDGLAEQPTRVVVFACAGEITGGDEPALVTGPNPGLYPDEDSLPLRWIADRLRGARAGQLLAVLSGRAPAGEGIAAAARWLEAMRTDGDRDLISIDVGRSGGIDALLSGVCGAALDPRTGTITLRSLGTHFVRTVRGVALQPSTASETLTSPPPLGLMHDVRATARTQALHNGRRPRAKDDTDDEITETDLIGTVLPGRFRVDAELARGSFGVVYRARQLSVDRDVAVKIMQAGIDPASDDGRLFVQEIQAVGRIDHPNVVRIHQADVTPDGRLFFAMELLDGRDLRQLLASGGILPVERAVELTRQLLAGLEAAHEAGLIHADVKPANALVVEGKAGERVVLVDFGLARLKPQEGVVEALGGTPAYMAPEQLRGERIDPRSDLFSAALVLVSLLTGWQRLAADQLAPPLDAITDPTVKAALARALAIDPGDRFATVGEFSDALIGKTSARDTTQLVRAPFRHLAAFTEQDAGRLHGRERDLGRLVEHALYRRVTIFTAPSGTGKTSLLRAGLVPRLGSLGARAVYFSCRSGGTAALAAAITPGATTLADAIRIHAERGTRLVLVLDQVEAALEGVGGSGDLIAEVLAADHRARHSSSDGRTVDLSVILSIREDFLARLIALRAKSDDDAAILRLGPLSPEGAREAIALPLVEARLTIESELLDALLVDLERAATTVGAELGWGGIRAVYPPHLQLAGSALYEALGRGETELTLAHYRRLGGLDAIVGEHLDRVLDKELDDASAKVARDVFLTLVTETHSRAVRSEAALVDEVGVAHGKAKVLEVLEALRTRGLMVRVRTSSGELGWELVHDSLIPRILAWIDRRDLARRRAIELVRYHLRRSRPEAPSLLSRDELREVRPHAAAIIDLDKEWASRGDFWAPSRLVEASRRARKRQTATIALGVLLMLGVVGVTVASWAIQRAKAQAEAVIRDRDIGRFAIELVPFDWDPLSLSSKPVEASRLKDLRWTLFEPSPDDDSAPGTPVEAHLLTHVRREPVAATRIDHIEARGGKAFLLIEGRGIDGSTCEPSVIPIKAVPGYGTRKGAEPVLRVQFPTCQASGADMVIIPDGAFVYGGLGYPISDVARDEPAERTINLPAFSIDRTEVSNAAYDLLAAQLDLTGIAMPIYPSRSPEAAAPNRPVASVAWRDARTFCRFFGKELPTSEQWIKSMRGGLEINGLPNPLPRRNLPWGEPVEPIPARLGVDGAAPIGTHPGDRSPYGVLDMAGNVQEWTDSLAPPANTVALGIGGVRAAEVPETFQLRITRGANWNEVSAEELNDFMAIENPRAPDYRHFGLGLRCASDSTKVAGRH
jgi:formylglycine-generating enzyme required for sulfatase activity